MNDETPRIVFGVPGPCGEKGVLLLAPRDEALEWDLRHEIASTSRYWLRERQAWWIAAPYVSTLHTIVGRFHAPMREVTTRGAMQPARQLPRSGSPVAAVFPPVHEALAKLRGRLATAKAAVGALRP